MNAAHFHLLVNHVPIVGAFIGFLLVFYASVVKKNISNIKAGLVIMVLSCLMILPVYFSGEGAEEVVEHLHGVSHEVIEEHEELAELGLFISLFVGLLSAIALVAIQKRHDKASLWTNVTLFGGVVLMGLFILIGHTGGEIRHPEIEQEEESTIDKIKPELHIHDSDGD